MKSISILVIASLVVSVLFSILMLQHPALYVVGGEYVIQHGETVSGNVYALFADVTLEQGAHVNGSLVSLYSDIDQLGTIGGTSWSVRFFGYTIRVPKLMHIEH